MDRSGMFKNIKLSLFFADTGLSVAPIRLLNNEGKDWSKKGLVEVSRGFILYGFQQIA